MKTIVSIVGIRPDFIRMSEIFKKLDENFNHIIVHTGQHYDDELSKSFFEDLNIREPNYILETGKNSTNHYEQLSYLSKEIVYLFKDNNIEPDIILFLGDSNSALASIPLFKEGYKIGHIEGGMRSYDRRMPEEVNRVCCDYVSDLVFVYTPIYKQRLVKENKDKSQIFVVGNTITEIINSHMPEGESRTGKYIVADIHRNENLEVEQYANVLNYLNELGECLNLTVKLVRFNRGLKLIEDHDMLKDKNHIELCGPYGFFDYLKLQFDAYGIVSDSGTAQEECPLLGVPVAVPRKKTERPESVEFGNSIMIGEDHLDARIDETIEFFKKYKISKDRVRWLGKGDTSQQITDILLEKL